MKLNKTQMSLLIEGAEHWDRVYLCKTKEEFRAEGWGNLSCALCEEYLRPISTACNACPIKLSTGKTNCGGAPYIFAACAIECFVKWGTPINYKLIKAECDFLREVIEWGKGDE